MRVRVSVTDNKGNVFEGEAELQPLSGKTPAKDKSPKASRSKTKLDFSLSNRAFMKQYAKGLSGKQKFALLLAKLTGGRVGPAKSFNEIEKAWNSMKALMGGKFNPAHTSRAKDDGWVDTPKPGSYVLTPGWTGAVGEK